VEIIILKLFMMQNPQMEIKVSENYTKSLEGFMVYVENVVKGVQKQDIW
jgi:hypothetical protein